MGVGSGCSALLRRPSDVTRLDCCPGAISRLQTQGPTKEDVRYQVEYDRKRERSSRA